MSKVDYLIDDWSMFVWWYLNQDEETPPETTIEVSEEVIWDSSSPSIKRG